MKLKICILFLMISAFSFGQERIRQDVMRHYSEKAQKFLDREKALSAYYSIDTSGIKIFASLNSKLTGKPEFQIGWAQLGDYKTKLQDDPKAAFEMYKAGKYQSATAYSLPVPELKAGNVNGTTGHDLPVFARKDLHGLRIAIDPGHIANDLATGDLEKKHIKFKQDLVRGLPDSIEIAEGMLTYATAVLLKQQLEAEGAHVMLTRPGGTSAFGKTYRQWKKEDLEKAVDSLYKTGELRASQRTYFLSPKADDRDIFRVIFRDLDLAKRAELVNEYNPDITIIIHYNVDETNAEWLHPSKRDFNMTFVGGAFMKNDLSGPEKRFEFLRLLVSDDLERSVELSSAVIGSFEKTLEVQTAGDLDARYITEGCIPAGKKGVYCRNLQLTRYIHSPLVYGETLYQDNIKESQLLNKETDKTKNIRVQQVADAYLQGILNFYNIKK
jgi:N-acetylmuramoyl-L-alanine amidase